MHGFAAARFFPGRFFCFFAFFDSLKPSRPAGLFSYRSVIPPFPHKALLRKPSQGPALRAEEKSGYPFYHANSASETAWESPSRAVLFLQ